MLGRAFLAFAFMPWAWLFFSIAQRIANTSQPKLYASHFLLPVVAGVLLSFIGLVLTKILNVSRAEAKLILIGSLVAFLPGVIYFLIGPMKKLIEAFL